MFPCVRLLSHVRLFARPPNSVTGLVAPASLAQFLGHIWLRMALPNQNESLDSAAVLQKDNTHSSCYLCRRSRAHSSAEAQSSQPYSCFLQANSSACLCWPLLSFMSFSSDFAV